METENLQNGWGRRKAFVVCLLCGDKVEVYEYADEVLEQSWYEIIVRDKNIDSVCEGYICKKCFEKYFQNEEYAG